MRCCDYIFVNKNNKPVCTISGAEYEYITVGDKQYEFCVDTVSDFL